METSECSSVEFRCYIIVLLINVLLDFKFIMLSRDALLAIGLVSGKLDTLTRQSVARAGCLRRGCQASRRVWLRTRRTVPSETETTGDIPVVATRRHLIHDYTSRLVMYH